jgi:tellurite resistance protein TerC
VADRQHWRSGETFGALAGGCLVIGDLGPWVVLAAIVGGMLVLDLVVLHRDAKAVAFREAAAWSVAWVLLALGFGVFVGFARGGTAVGEYLAGYLVELSLSVDNVFVFALLFSAFAVPSAYQHRLLFWGVLGAVIFRAVFIAAGTAVLAAAHWVIYLLGAFLIVTGLRLARSNGHAVSPDRNPVLRIFRRLVPMTDDFRGPAFIVRERGRRLATPMLAALVAIETTDIVFALDSIPAVFAVTTEPFIVFSSNLFAILGLRSLYFLLAGLLDRFVYLRHGLAALMTFAGGKILAGALHVEIPIAVSLSVIVLILTVAIGASVIATHPRKETLVLAMIRIGSGVAMGLALLGLMALAAAARDGALRGEAIAVALLVAGGAVGVGCAALTLLPRLAPRLARQAGRAGGAVLACTLVLAGAIGAGVGQGADARWILLEAGVLLAAIAGLLLAFAFLRLRHARPATLRACATLGAAALLVLALFIALD